MIKAMDAFGGGLGAHGEVCGTVIGAMAAIGLFCGRAEPGIKADTKMWKCCRIFMKRYRDEVSGGKILCRELVNVDWADPAQIKAYQGSDKYEYCVTLTGKTAKLVGEILEKTQT